MSDTRLLPNGPAHRSRNETWVWLCNHTEQTNGPECTCVIEERGHGDGGGHGCVLYSVVS